MSGAPEPTGTLEVALAHAAKLLVSDPTLAGEQATEILKVAPGHPVATIILGASHRARGDAPSALAILEPLAVAHPDWVSTHYELGLAYGVAGRSSEAAAELRRAVELKPEMGDAWRALADHLAALGDPRGADAAYAQHIRCATRDPRLLRPAAALCDGRIAVAEALLREHLKRFPTDVVAIRMLAEVAARLGRFADSETLLARCLELAPGFNAARHNYAVVLHRQDRLGDALREVDRLLAADPTDTGGRNLKAAILGKLGEARQSAEIYRQVLSEYPQNANLWQSYGHALKTAGLQGDAIAAYRRSTEVTPGFGEAYWSLANLKTFRFTPQDVEAMLAQLARTDLTIDDRFHFNFALGKALEDAGNYEASFRHYAEGNRLRRSVLQYDAAEMTDRVRQMKALFTREFIALHAGSGCPAVDPIFVVGLPRAGSTLIEQILSSHSEVEGTMELPDIGGIARDLGGRRKRSEVSAYPGILATLGADELRALGTRYLEQTRIQRKTAAPRFLDKMPNNWAHIGLIQLILPNAKIIDARRHPMSCCFSVFKQHFARGQRYSYDLVELGCYYRDYVELMAHFDDVMPGRIHRVIYDRMVDDTEGEVRRLLDYCGLPFEEGCLRFYENERAVRTASSEQVRRPIYRDALEQWTHYKPWLGPLEQSLGPALSSWASSSRA
ncbi:MAG: sulfotransferase [Steroidobacteraceae bacterium]